MSSSALPHDLEAERSLLGGIIIHNELFEDVAPAIKPQHFSLLAHEHIYRAIGELRNGDSPVDFRLLIAELQRVNKLEEVGGPAYIASLVDGVPRSTNVPHYARLVLDKALRRALVFEARRVEQLAVEGDESAREILESTEARLLELDRRADGASSDARSAQTMALDTFALLERLWKDGGRRGLDTGLDDLDNMTRGLRPGQLIVVGARPSMGKSALSTQLALHVAKTAPVLMFSLEMSCEELSLRAVSMLSAISTSVIESGKMPPHAQGRVGNAIGEYGELKLHIDETAGIGAAQVRSKARRRKQQGGLGLVCVDYLQLMSTSESKGENRNIQLGEISASMKRLARELECPVVLLSQLNRNVEHRTDKRPSLADLRESGAIEQDADTVLLLHRPHYYDKTQDPTFAEIIIAKQRSGPTGSVLVTWQEHTTTFHNRTTMKETPHNG